MRPQATFSFFIFYYNFFVFFLSPHRSFLLVPPSSSSHFFPRPALYNSFRIRKSPLIIDFHESITDGRTNRPTDKASYRDADASKKCILFNSIFILFLLLNELNV